MLCFYFLVEQTKYTQYHGVSNIIYTHFLINMKAFRIWKCVKDIVISHFEVEPDTVTHTKPSTDEVYLNFTTVSQAKSENSVI